MRRSFDASEWRGALDLFEARQISLDFEGLIVADQNDGRELEKLQILTFLNSRPHSLAPVDDLKAQLLEANAALAVRKDRKRQVAEIPSREIRRDKGRETQVQETEFE